MKVLVTGIAGFIGSKLALSLIEKGYEVVGIDDYSTGFKKNVPSQSIMIEGDVSDPLTIEKINQYSFDYIFHFAGQSSGEISFEDPVNDLKTNTSSTLLLLDFAAKKNIKRFFYASSMSVYGDKNEYVNEQSETNPKSFYGVGKLASEKYLSIYSNSNLKCTSLRLFNVYGENQNFSNLKQGMISIYLSMALKNGKIQVKGSKDRFRDFIEINDVIKAILFLLNTPQENSNETYNISTGNKTMVEKVIKLILQYLNTNIDVSYSGSTPGDQFGIYGNNKKIKMLGWNPEIEFESGLKNLILKIKNE